jgi:hypothetical protein
MDADDLSNWLLKQSPECVLQWLHEIVEGTPSMPAGLNWHGLAECAAFDVWHTGGHPTTSPNIGWARVAVFAYSYIIDKVREQGHFLQARPRLNAERREQLAFSFEEPLMNLRVSCINRLGPIPGDPVLDLTHLFDWFFQNLRLSPEEIPERFAPEKRVQLRLAEKWELTRILRKLAILERLDQHYLLDVRTDLQAWFFMREQMRYVT